MVRVELLCDVVAACLTPAHAPCVSHWQQPPVSAVTESVLCLSGPSSGSLFRPLEWKVLFLVCSARFVLCGWIVTG